MYLLVATNPSPWMSPLFTIFITNNSKIVNTIIQLLISKITIAIMPSQQPQWLPNSLYSPQQPQSTTVEVKPQKVEATANKALLILWPALLQQEAIEEWPRRLTYPGGQFRG